MDNLNPKPEQAEAVPLDLMSRVAQVAQNASDPESEVISESVSQHSRLSSADGRPLRSANTSAPGAEWSRNSNISDASRRSSIRESLKSMFGIGTAEEAAKKSVMYAATTEEALFEARQTYLARVAESTTSQQPMHGAGSSSFPTRAKDLTSADRAALFNKKNFYEATPKGVGSIDFLTSEEITHVAKEFGVKTPMKTPTFNSALGRASLLDVDSVSRMTKQRPRNFGRNINAIEEDDTDIQDMNLLEEVLLLKDEKKLKFAWFFYQMMVAFSGDTVFICLPIFYASVPESQAPLILAVQVGFCVTKVVVMALNLIFGINKLYKPYTMLRINALVVLGCFLIMASFVSNGWILLFTILGFAVVMALGETPLFTMSTYFPNGEELRGMLSKGEGFAGLIAVTAQTIIRAIVYATVDNDMAEDVDAETVGNRAANVAFWAFIIVFCLMAFLSFLIAWFVPNLESFRHFEARHFQELAKHEHLASVNGNSQKQGVIRLFETKFISDIAVTVWIAFIVFFTSRIVYPNMARAFESPDADNAQLVPLPADIISLDEAGWPFNNSSVQKWFWNPGVLGTYYFCSFIGRHIPSWLRDNQIIFNIASNFTFLVHNRAWQIYILLVDLNCYISAII